MTLEQLASTIGSDEKSLGEVVQEAAICKCLHRISRGIDRFDRELFLSGYHEDAVISAGAMVTDPASAFDGGSALHDDGQTLTQHHLTNHTSEIAGDVAHCETYYLYAGRNRDGSNWLAGGRYIDRVERREGSWRVAFRQTLVEWSGAMSAIEVPLFSSASDSALNGAGSRDRGDPSYRRPFTNLRELHIPDNVQEMGRVTR